MRVRWLAEPTFPAFFELSIGFHEERTAEENVRMHAMLQGLPPKGVAEILGHVREFAGIHEHWDLPLKCYSVGQRLRLGFAVTTASPADVLLLDEIFAVGDADFQKRCRQRLKDLNTLREISADRESQSCGSGGDVRQSSVYGEGMRCPRRNGRRRVIIRKRFSPTVHLRPRNGCPGTFPANGAGFANAVPAT